ncbi:hypothetical protein GJU40_03555 [Bacillus lacus]|uniref:Zinc finger CGNR domain-containing protein n=1 Tax=Metabacillus lacus TaxID=1983721 RepID=A0A7X2IY36_9BACI|nr:CGNR zinc finger domain-containing protein [Metabacillus lacus]MRX71248.1 hypothetical protein [Metabacillus lacus]
MNTSTAESFILRFLNTWEIPNDTRVPIENLKNQDTLTGFFQQETTDDVKQVILFRNSLRQMVETSSVDEINYWITNRVIGSSVRSDSGRYMVEFHTTRNSLIDHMLIQVLRKVEEGNFHRFKICPDCKWAFYDTSKSSTKKWCSMTKNSASGRACGTISKVKRFREKQRDGEMKN